MQCSTHILMGYLVGHTWSCFQDLCLHWRIWVLPGIPLNPGPLFIETGGAYWRSPHLIPWCTLEFPSKWSNDRTYVLRDQNHNIHLGNWPCIPIYTASILKNWKADTQWSRYLWFLSPSCGCELTGFILDRSLQDGEVTFTWKTFSRTCGACKTI